MDENVIPISDIVSKEYVLQELAKYFTSGNDVPVERATILAKDFFRITGLTLEDLK